LQLFESLTLARKGGTLRRAADHALLSMMTKSEARATAQAGNGRSCSVRSVGLFDQMIFEGIQHMEEFCEFGAHTCRPVDMPLIGLRSVRRLNATHNFFSFGTFAHNTLNLRIT